MVRRGRGGTRQFQHPVGELRPAMLAGPTRLGIGRQRRLGLQQQPLGHPDLGFGLYAAGNQRHEVAGPQLGLAGHLPRGRPDQRARQRLGDVGDALQRGLQRLGVQPQ